MFLQRTAVTAARRAAFVAPVVRRGFSTSMLRRTIAPGSPSPRASMIYPWRRANWAMTEF